MPKEPLIGSQYDIEGINKYLQEQCAVGIGDLVVADGGEADLGVLARRRLGDARKRPLCVYSCDGGHPGGTTAHAHVAPVKRKHSNSAAER